MLKNRKQHFKKYCKHFKYYYCEATVCHIKANKQCSCEYCKFHDCYDLRAYANNDNDDSHATTQNDQAKQLSEAE